MYSLHKFYTIEELKEALHKYIDFYNNHRLQSRYHDQTPNEVRNQALQSETAEQYPISQNNKVKKYYDSLNQKNNSINSITETII